MTLSPSRHAVVQTLKIIWTAFALYYELWTFYRHASSCTWPIIDQQTSSKVEHVLLVADPQILDMNSYPDRHPALQWLSQVVVDLNLRKNWRAALRTRPDKTIFLGDMMDNGRMSMGEQEYDAYYRRFRRVFKGSDADTVYYIPGNHDIGLGAPSAYSRSAQADERYVSHFGNPNKVVHTAGHALVMIDAPSLVDEDRQRVARGQTFTDWPASPNSTASFVKGLARQLEDTVPRILLTHIPLHRPPASDCGPLRERGTIRAGQGFGYENTIGADASRLLLDTIRPSFIFSGDDHDYCAYSHRYSGRTAEEITVKSLSMAMGIRQPGYQLLSLAAPSAPSATSHATTHCLLPDQLRIYLAIYIPLLLISLAAVVLINALEQRRSRLRPRPRIKTFRPLTRGVDLDMIRSPNWQQLHHREDEQDVMTDESYVELASPSRLSDEKARGALPAPASSRARRSRPLQRVSGPLERAIGTMPRALQAFASLLKRTLQSVLHSPRPSRSRGFVREVLYDVRDVAVFPITIFCIITWWMFTDS
ncbi:Metallo-dependent phosphatase-like protein [Schizophyllum amplum]|uniref:Metallo-dependent phosphatase-like protein n=1 Tax=Schizophyllum amplum TaxID=97359 RepID=A0A550CZ07_9AGAR|nr:Metallo-dependent phosphatase-like protein [Auriculariopsis ampla]